MKMTNYEFKVAYIIENEKGKNTLISKAVLPTIEAGMEWVDPGSLMERNNLNSCAITINIRKVEVE